MNVDAVGAEVETPPDFNGVWLAAPGSIMGTEAGEMSAPVPPQLIVRTVLTLSELSEFLDFRHELIEKWSHVVSALPESALMGQYLAGAPDQRPDLEFIQALEALEHCVDEWDLSGIIKYFPERVTTNGTSTEYYAIVAELAKLNRNELQQFKTRFQLSMQKCASDNWVRPYRMATPRTDRHKPIRESLSS